MELNNDQENKKPINKDFKAKEKEKSGSSIRKFQMYVLIIIIALIVLGSLLGVLAYFKVF